MLFTRRIFILVQRSDWKINKKNVKFVVFIPFWELCFWSLLATKLQKYYVIVCSFFISSCPSCLANRKHFTENHATRVKKKPKKNLPKYVISRAIEALLHWRLVVLSSVKSLYPCIDPFFLYETQIFSSFLLLSSTIVTEFLGYMIQKKGSMQHFSCT